MPVPPLSPHGSLGTVIGRRPTTLSARAAERRGAHDRARHGHPAEHREEDVREAVADQLIPMGERQSLLNQNLFQLGYSSMVRSNVSLAG